MNWKLHGARRGHRQCIMFPAAGVPGSLGLLLLVSLGQVVVRAGCPRDCDCEHLLVNCTGKRLQHFPMGIPLDTRQLVLANNLLPALPSISLNILMDLVYLDCSGNSLDDSLEATFISLPLVYLDLSFNNLSRVSAGTFCQLTSLVVLKLSDNPSLVEIELDAFANNTGLRELDLSRTGLTYLDVSTVSQLPNLRTLGLSSNPWHCYCPLKDFCKWVRDSDLYFPDAANISCHSPPQVRGTLVPEMQDKMNHMCLINLYEKDYAFLMLIGLFIFSMGTVVAWAAGVCMVLYNRLCKSDDSHDYTEDEPQSQPPTRCDQKDQDFEVYINAYV